MKINNVTTTGSVFQQESLSKKEKSVSQEKSKTNNINISTKAKEMANAQELNPRQRAQILYRLSTGFYDQEEVLNKVAGEILKSEEFQESIKE